MDDLASLSLELAQVASFLAFLYLAAGWVVAALLFWRGGLEVIDPVTKSSSAGFRWLILPGAVALWPLLLRRWRRGEAEVER